MHSSGASVRWRATFVAVVAAAWSVAAAAQPQGGLYIAGAGFGFEVAAERAMAQNPGGGRFFLLSLPPETAALYAATTGSRATVRDRVVAANGVLLVCQRDIDNRKIKAEALVPGAVRVRGWPPKGSNEPPAGQRYFADEDPTKLPASNEALRQLRSTCS